MHITQSQRSYNSPNYHQIYDLTTWELPILTPIDAIITRTGMKNQFMLTLTKISQVTHNET